MVMQIKHAAFRQEIGELCSTYGRDEKYMRACTHTHKILVGKPEGKRSCGRPMHRWEDNIRMDLREIGWEVVGWIHLA
jgi:hypothetical protein